MTNASPPASFSRFLRPFAPLAPASNAGSAITRAATSNEERRLDLAEAIAEGDALARSVLAREISQKTADAYQVAFKRMARRKLSPEAIGARSRASFAFYRAALVRCVAERLAHEVVTARLVQEGTDDATKAIEAITQLTKILERYPVGGAPDGRSRWTRRDGGENRRGKRRGLSNLPPNWRERLVAVFEGTEYADAVAVLALTGCRPAELVAGVEVSASADELAFRITGAKTTAERGQPWRSLRVAPEGPAAERLRTRLGSEPSSQAIIRINDARRFCDAIRSASRKVWPSVGYVASPFSFRHAFAADLKGARSDAGSIAAALGHSSAVTQQRYGVRQQSRGRRVDLIAAEAARPVRPAGAKGPPPSFRSRTGAATTTA